LGLAHRQAGRIASRRHQSDEAHQAAIRTHNTIGGIELRGVRQGERGRIFGGKANSIACERAQSFVIVPRAGLAALIPQIVDAKSRVAKPADAKYKAYQRANRPDLLTLVEMTQLDKIKIAEWEK